MTTERDREGLLVRYAVASERHHQAVLRHDWRAAAVELRVLIALAQEMLEQARPRLRIVPDDTAQPT